MSAAVDAARWRERSPQGVTDMMASRIPLAILVVVMVGLAMTGNLFSRSSIVIGVQIAAVALNLWARSSFGKGAFRVSAAPGGDSVLRHGPYRVVRHPMYVAALIFVWAGILSHASFVTLVVGAGLTGMLVARVRAEEELLRKQYPDYQAYARTTKALVPFLF